MLETFLINPFIALILTAISCSLLGVFVLWKKLSYFGDALSHAILLGVIIGGIFNFNQILTLAIFAIIFSAALNASIQNKFFSKNTLIAIFSYFCVALAIILNDIFNKNFNFSSFIFGDILTVANQDIIALFIICITSIIFTKISFKKMLLININQDLAQIHGIKCNLWNLMFLILLSLTIAFCVKIVGIFLITALLILPAAIARIFCLCAKSMLIYSLIISTISAIFSFGIANYYNLTIGSTLIAILSIIFIISFFGKKYVKI